MTIVLVVTATILVTYLYTSSHYVGLLYAIHVLLLTPFSLLLVKAKNKSEVLFIAVIILLIVRMLPRLSNIFSGYVLALGDEGYDLSTASITLLNGRLVYENINAHNVEYINYPMLYIFTVILHLISDVDFLPILVILPQIISLAILLLFYKTFKSNDLNKLKMATIVGVAFLLTGIHAQYWSTLVREAYASIFSILLLLNIIKIFMTSESFSPLTLILAVLALTFSHYASNIYTILAVALLLTSLVLQNRFITSSSTLSVKNSTQRFRRVRDVIFILLFANIVYILYNEFISRYTFNWLATLIEEIVYYPINVAEVVLNVGSALYMFEMIFIYIHYVALLLLLFLLLHKVSHNRGLPLKLFLFMLIISYFLLAYARFIPGQGRYPLMRFAHYVLFTYLVTSLSLFKKQENFRPQKNLIAVSSILLVLLAMGYLAQVSPLFKYRDYRLSVYPHDMLNFVIVHTNCDFNLGYIVLEPFVPVNRYAFSLLDSHNTMCSGIEYFQFSLSNFRIYGNSNRKAINIVISSPKLGEPILQDYPIVYNSHDIVLQPI
ncbi:MAG: hypothetical protein NDF52_06950 [archaeon YNP-WB-062]|nr:hypothetical protein [Candidatus Culexarchaeum yellowstonense]